ncbi:hypothetical protein ACLQ24_12890 [Micromonospora sp. DT4]|uniref:hypothetical protein n=1 Tax=Micromonospora sp. DT4 TaxID=3393438 RepID=UPI003CF7B36B
MGTVYPEIDGRLREFIAAQPVFFVATAPSGPEGAGNQRPRVVMRYVPGPPGYKSEHGA